MPRAGIWVVPFRYDRIRSREAQSPRGRVFWDCTVHLSPCSLPRDLSTTLEMTGQNTVPLCFGRTMASAPTTLYPSKCGHRRLAHRGSLSAGRGRPALPRRCCARQEFVVHRQNTRGRTRASAPTCSTKGKYGHRQLASGGSPSGGRGTHLPYKASPWGEAVALRLMRGCFIRYVLY